jgi:hypothetical protein
VQNYSRQPTSQEEALMAVSRTSTELRHSQWIEEDHLVAWWNESMATCFAHLLSALSAIEELAINPGSSRGDAYYYDQASASVSVALVALDACCPAGIQRISASRN